MLTKEQIMAEAEYCREKLITFPEIKMAVEICENALRRTGTAEGKEAEDFVTLLCRDEFYGVIDKAVLEKEDIDNIKISLLNRTFDKIHIDDPDYSS